jgi:hypothetical protein
VVPEHIIVELKARCVNGPIERVIIHLTQGTFPCNLFSWRTESAFLL